MLKLIGKLPIAVNTFRFRFVNRSYEHDTFILITSGFGIYNTQFTMLRSMVSHKNSHQLTSARDLTNLCHCCREPAIHSVIFRLPCSIGIHLEQRLRPYLPAVIVIPTSINHTTVIQQSRSDSVHLIETDLTHITSFPIAEIHIADFRKPTIYRASTTGRVEKNIIIRQVNTFNVGMSFPKSQLFDFTCLQIHFIQMKVILLTGLLPGEKQVLTVEVEVRITNHSFFICQQRFYLRPDTIHLHLCQRAARNVITFGTGIRNTFGISKERRTQRSVLCKNNLRFIGYEGCQTLGTSLFTRFQIRLESCLNVFRSISCGSFDVQFLQTHGKFLV